MKNTLFTAVLCTLFLAAAASAAPTTRYWDSCKPSCGWNGNVGGSPNGLCTSCDIKGAKLSGEGGQSACQNGPAFTCMGQAPWAVDDNLSYGFAAAHTNGDCGKCFELTFTSNGEGGTSGGSITGKKMIIMVSNIGDIRAGAAFDLMIPGGGVGDFDALTRQISQNGGPNNPSMGARYGGFRADYEGGCGNNATCVRKMCDDAFGSAGLADLKAGCYWFIDWFKIANNPTADHREVTCPAALVSAYKEGKGGGVINPPQTQTWTLQVGRNPTAGGSVTVNGTQHTGQTSHNAGTTINLTAAPANGYTFQNWTAVSGGSLPSGLTATNATGSFSINANVNIQANFQSTTPPTTNYSLQASRNPTAGGSVSVKVGNGNAQTNPQNSQQVAANTSVTLTATENSGYTFANWSGLPQGVSGNSATVTFNISANVNAVANFTRTDNPGQTTYTLTVTREPAAGGTTNPASSQSNISAGTPVNISAMTANGYNFTGWTVTTGQATFADASSAATTVTLSSNATIRANFSTRQDPGGVNRTDTVKVEAEDLTAPQLGQCDPNSNSNPMCKGSNATSGITNIGWITDGNSATYNVSVGKAGAKTMVFRIASNYDQGNSSFTVTVNGTQVGTITGHTGDWDGYTYVTLSGDVQFNAGANTVKLDFKSPVNVDYFLIIGEPAQQIVSVGYSAPKAASLRSAVTLMASPRGFTAALAPNHGYTSYRLIDMRGREVRSGKIGQGVTDLRFDNLKRGVLFLKLDGKGSSPVVVRAVTY